MPNLEVLLLRRVLGTEIICDQINSKGLEPRLCPISPANGGDFLETLHLTPGIFGESFWGANKNFYTRVNLMAVSLTLSAEEGPSRPAGEEQYRKYFSGFKDSFTIVETQIFQPNIIVAPCHLQTTKLWA